MLELDLPTIAAEYNNLSERCSLTNARIEKLRLDLLDAQAAWQTASAAANGFVAWAKSRGFKL